MTLRSLPSVRSTAAIAISFVLALAGAASAQDADPSPDVRSDPRPDPRIDAATGRDTANWPLAPTFDHLHMKLDLSFPDMSQATFTATQTLTLAARGTPRAVIPLRAGPGIEVQSVAIAGQPCEFSKGAQTLDIRPATPAGVGQPFDVVITYTCDFSANRGIGLTHSKPRDEGSPTDQAVQVHAQGEAEVNHLWFPCHDFPNEKLTTELIVSVPEGFEVLSNGRLVAKDSLPDGRSRVHWHQDLPHPYYLVTLVIAKISIVDIGGDATARPGLPMAVWTPVGTEENVKTVFSSTPAMVAFLEKKLDEPYPWAKYDQAIIRDFNWGGMENTSATTLYRRAANATELGDEDGLIVHELGHQWFGDLMTCKGWKHLWLNEGWASYCEAMWNEQYANAQAAGLDPIKTGEIAAASEEGRKAYQRTVLGFVRRQRGGNNAYAPVYPSIVSNRYRNPDENFSKSDDVYSKGAIVLHMLRTGLGDDVFWKGVRLYIDRHKFTHVETDQFRRAFEDVSGRSLERFFDQWTARPGLPRMDVDLTFDDAGKTLGVVVRQTQRIDKLNPAYQFSLPLFCKFEDGSHQYIYLDVKGREAAASFNLPSKPTQVSVDPTLTVFGANRITKPLAMWMNELQEGPALFAQVAAAEALALHPGDEVRALLARAAMDPSFDPVVREASLASLTGLEARRIAAALGSKFGTGPTRPATRAMAVAR
ncbi:MAG: M1 family metallopeptidase [Phycisphaerae bacterium]|nr:M1 family metallopeptidase [Phycisphaerae bacterium]